MHHAPPSSEDTVPPRPQRGVEPLPLLLLDHSTVCLEEELYSQGFALQTRCLESGVETDAPARVPPPPHFTFASTLTVHPKLTTRTRKKDRHVASNDALRYLRHAINTVDVNDDGLKKAFRFENNRSQSERSKRASTRRSDATNASEEEAEKPGFLRSEYYQKQSLWTHAEDFWAIVGWAFNCSVLHKGRWERWKAWLGQMLDMLHNDLEDHIMRSKDNEDVNMDECMLAQFISTVGEGRNNRRRIMRAITADGSKKVAAEFGEIWKNETKPPKKEKDDYSSKRRKLDIDNDQYGDYDDPDSENESSDSKRRKTESNARSSKSRRSKEGPKDDEFDRDTDGDDDEQDGRISTLTGVDAFGGMDSIRLRQRLLDLLTRFSREAPERFMDTEESFSLFTEFIRPLPLSIFQQFVMPLKPFMSTNMHAALLEILFQPFLGTAKTRGFVDQKAFEATFAPQAAITTSAIDNAKVSLLTESLLRALWNSNVLKGDMDSLRLNIKKGIKAREEKVAYDGRKKVGRRHVLDEQARTSLKCSGERMLVLLDVMAS